MAEHVERLSPRFVGLYWTYPVPWIDFTKLGLDAESAAQKSRTIRYQRDLVQRHVAEERGTLVDEVVFMELRPDRPTNSERVSKAVAWAKQACKEHKATLLYIDFGQERWRHHSYLRQAMDRAGLRSRPLPPLRDVILSDGQPFDPVRHFRTWRQELLRSDERRDDAVEGLRAAASEIPPQRGRYRLIAEKLNAAGSRTKTGRLWEPDNVKAAMRAEEIE